MYISRTHATFFGGHTIFYFNYIFVYLFIDLIIYHYIMYIFKVFIGVFGLVGPMLQFIGPIVIAPTIALIGLALFQAASNFCASNWWIAAM